MEEMMLEVLKSTFVSFDHRDIPYVLEVALYLPVLVLVHLWMLFSPDSDYWILSVLSFILRYGGSFVFLLILNFRRSRLLYFYVCVCPLIAFEPIVFNLHASAVTLASGYSSFSLFCVVEYVVTLFALLLLFQKLVLHSEWNTLLFRSSLLTVVLVGFFWSLNQNRFASMVYTMIILLCASVTFLIAHSNDYNNRVQVSLLQWILIDVWSLFGIVYYTYAIICELRNGMHLHDLVSVNACIHIIGKWCTSLVVLNSVVFVFALVANIIIFIIRYCLFSERPHTHLYSGIGSNIVIPFHVFALLSGILQLTEEKRVDATNTLLHYSLGWFFVNIWFMFQPLVLQLGATAAERRLQVHFRVLCLTIILVLGSLKVSLNIAAQLNIGIWSVLYVSGCMLLMSSILFSVLEYTANMFSWFCNLDLTNIIDHNYYLGLLRTAGIIVCGILEGYYRLFFPLFPHNIIWLTVYGLTLLLSQLLIFVPIVYLEYLRHLQRIQSLAIVKSLPWATPSQLASLDDVCAICLEEIQEGLVTPCSHIFHLACLKRACAIRETCPMCNQVISLTSSTSSDDPQPQLLQIIVMN